MGNGSLNLQNSGLLKHNLSNQHIYARTRGLGSQGKIARTIKTHMQEALESNKVKIISSMKNGCLQVFSGQLIQRNPPYICLPSSSILPFEMINVPSVFSFLFRPKYSYMIKLHLQFHIVNVIVQINCDYL